MKNINAPLFQNEGKTFIPHKTLKILYVVGFVEVSQSVQHISRWCFLLYVLYYYSVLFGYRTVYTNLIFPLLHAIR